MTAPLAGLSNDELLTQYLQAAFARPEPGDSPEYSTLLDLGAEVLRRMESRASMTCPKCGSDPMPHLSDFTRAVCSSRHCEVWSWDPRKPHEWVSAETVLQST